MKRLFDFLVALIGLLVASPILLLFMLLVWLQDFDSPLYIAPRVGKGGRPFSMVKLRSMVKNADSSGVASTAAGDMRITPLGKLIRKLKLDELTQLWNVLLGHMSLVGPRPQVQQDVDLYTDVERGLLRARPGITDFASIVFADEGDILAPYSDADLAYQQLIRPWKSRLGLFYIDNRSLVIDLKLIMATVINAGKRSLALSIVTGLLEHLRADADMLQVAHRNAPLEPAPPPGAVAVFQRT